MDEAYGFVSLPNDGSTFAGMYGGHSTVFRRANIHPHTGVLAINEIPFFTGLRFNPESLPSSMGEKGARPRRRRTAEGDHVKHRRTRSGCYICRSRRIKVGASPSRTDNDEAKMLIGRSVMRDSPPAKVCFPAIC